MGNDVKPTKQKAGKTTEAKPEGARYRTAAGKEPTVRAEWSQVDPHLLRSAIDSVTTLGDALIIGRTSDGGAYSITVLAGSHRFRYYPSSVDECEDVLKSIKEDADSSIFK